MVMHFRASSLFAVLAASVLINHSLQAMFCPDEWYFEKVRPKSNGQVPSLTEITAQYLANQNHLPDDMIVTLHDEFPNGVLENFRMSPNAERILVAKKILRLDEYAYLTVLEKRAAIHNLRGALSKITILADDKKVLFLELIKAFEKKLEDNHSGDLQAFFEDAYGYKSIMSMIILLPDDAQAIYLAHPFTAGIFHIPLCSFVFSAIVKSAIFLTPKSLEWLTILPCLFAYAYSIFLPLRIPDINLVDILLGWLASYFITIICHQLIS